MGEDDGDLMADRGLAQIEDASRRRHKGKGLAQIEFFGFGGNDSDQSLEANGPDEEGSRDEQGSDQAQVDSAESRESRTETPAQFVLYRGDSGYVSSDSQDSDDDEVNQAAYLGRRGGNLAQIEHSGELNPDSEESDWEHSSDGWSLAQISKGRTGRGREVGGNGLA